MIGRKCAADLICVKLRCVRGWLEVGLQGRCDEEDCHYAHTSSELRHTDNLYKTSLCIQFAKGECQNGEFCRYAHGVVDLRDSQSKANCMNKSTVSIRSSHKGSNKSNISHDSSSSMDDESFISAKGSVDMDEQEARPWLVKHEANNPRYEHLNPFFFYTLNNFPMPQFGNGGQSIPIFNYVTPTNTLSTRHGGSTKQNSENADTKCDSMDIGKCQTLSENTINEMLKSMRSGL